MYGLQQTASYDIQTATDIQHFVSDFISYIDTSASTSETYLKALRRFFRYLQDNNIKQPIRDDVIAYKDFLKVSVKPATVQLYITALKQFFLYLEDRNLYPNICTKVKGMKVNKAHKRDYLTASQIHDLLLSIDTDTVTGKRDYAITMLMASCGLRTIEVSRATVQDLRTRAGNIVLYVQGKGRTDKSDFVIVPRTVESAIREYLITRGAVEPQEPLFASISNNSKGKALTTRSIRGLIKKHLSDINIVDDRLSAHSLRHSSVTLALLGGEKLESASQFARHTDLSTTMIYNHSLSQDNNTCSNTVINAIL